MGADPGIPLVSLSETDGTGSAVPAAMRWWPVVLGSLSFTAIAGFVGCGSDPAARDGDTDSGLSDAAPAPSPSADAGSDALEASAPPLRVLFVGNSYTYVNDLPSVVHALGATTPGAAVEVESVTEGSAQLRTHWSNGTAPARIASGDVDVVVLQGQSVEAFGTFANMDFYPYAQMFADAARDAGVSVLWYATWARRAGDDLYQGWRTTPEFMMRSIEHSYRHAAEQWGGTVARVGAAWQLALAELPGVALHADDGSHPTPAGTLLTACTMFLALTGKEAVLGDPIPLGIDRPTATALCALAPRVLCGPGGCGCENATQVTTTHAALQALEPACDGWESNEQISLECSAAMSAACASTACVNAGFYADVTADVKLTCVDGTTLDTTFTALRDLDPSCDGTTEGYGGRCATAVDRACRAKGALGGFGPTSVEGDVVKATCVKAGNALRVHLDSAPCTWGAACNAIIDGLCKESGFAGGFGPIETTDAGAADYVCVAW
jgi:hypothetical protein